MSSDERIHQLSVLPQQLNPFLSDHFMVAFSLVLHSIPHCCDKPNLSLIFLRLILMVC